MLYIILCYQSFYCLCRDFLDKDMSRTKMIIGYLPPLLALEDPELELFITKLVTFETDTDQGGM